MCRRNEDEPEMIEDEDASMPDGWLESEPALIADPSAQRPTDWWVNDPLYLTVNP